VNERVAGHLVQYKRSPNFAKKFRTRLQKFLVCNRNIALVRERVPRSASDEANASAIRST
jgi:hypothetical protein